MRNEELGIKKKGSEVMVIKRVSKLVRAALAVIFVSVAILGYGQKAPSHGGIKMHESPRAVNPFATFRDVPGITAKEIAAIEALQKEHPFFNLGANLSTEAFLTENAEIGGFITLFCKYLTDFFGIHFQPEIYSWNDLLAKLNDRTADFMANLTATEERRKIYFMTDPIAERQLKLMRISGSPSLERIAQERLPRYALLRTSNSRNLVAGAAQPGSYESVDVNDTEDAYQALLSGRADAYIEADIQVNFYHAVDVYTEDFFPLLFTHVSMATANPAFESIISVMNKALQNGARNYVNHLNNLGYEEYKKDKFLSQLTAEEKAYLSNPSTVQLVARYYNYPMDFYNNYDLGWEGIAFDVLAEVEKLTGLKFEVANEKNAEVTVLLEMLHEGKAHMAFDLPYTASREDWFIWSQNHFLSNQYALLSKTDFPNVRLNEIANARIGLIANTAHAEMFRTWFPEAPNTREYETVDDGFLALERGEVDMVMSSKNRLLSLLNYYELSDYKANYLFNYSESAFAFNKDESVLCSIVDKALPFIETDTIVEQWMTKTYDYKTKLMEERLPWFFGAGVLALIILVLLLILFYRAINDRKRLAKLVAEKTFSLKVILDGTPDIIFHKDLNFCFTECNKAMEIFTNLPKNKIIGKPASHIFNWSPEKVGQHIEREQKVYKEMQPLIAEEIVSSYDGISRTFEIIRTPLIQDGEVVGLVGVARDITRRKNAEEAAKKASADAMKAFAEAETASEAKSRFMANMSHEIRTPMNVIVGLTDLMLEEDTVPDTAKETLKKINTAGNALMGLINDVLDISKIEAGKQDLNPVEYEVASFLNDIITLNIVRIGERPITFKLDLDDSLPGKLFGDDIRVKQVLNNLLSNAFKYTERGTVTLGARGRHEGDHVWVDFSVSDTGIGIRKEDVGKLFSDYNQVDTRANRKIEGTGLGLSITKKFVEMMGGEITVESEYGKGTTFRARILQGFVTDTPIAKETVENLRSFHYTDQKKQAQGKVARMDLSYAKVLVVDDFPMNLDVAAGMLRKYKMQVDCVRSGQEAVDRIQAGEPVYDTIFMDHMMPGMDGVEATKLIRALGTGYAEKIPVIALTANAVAGNEQMFLDNGFNAFLPKPFSVRSLDSIVRKWVRDKERE
jgi:PAS domain S-box-containing protein